MVKRNANAPDTEPEQMSFEIPSCKKHLLQVVEIFEEIDPDPDIIHAKLEVVGGDEEGRSILHRCCLDDSRKEFFFTRMFLKVIGEKYKGDNFPIDTENWIGKQAYGLVEHTSKNGKTYANVAEWDFENMVEQSKTGVDGGMDKDTKPESEIAWDEDK